MIQKIIFTGSMDSDTSPELMPSSSGRYRLNVRIANTENGNEEAAEIPKGNTLLAYTLPPGLNYVIGSKEYEKINVIVYFIWNQLGEHRILLYDEVSNVLVLILEGDFLNFKKENLITGINFVELDATNHLLYWTDFRNEPRKINIEKGIAYSQGDYINGYPFPFEERWITRIKQPPAFPPISSWSNDTAQKINYLFKKNFTFQYLYIYDDFEESSYSPISTYSFPVTVLGTPTTGEDFQTQDNKLSVTVNTGSSIVKKIRISGKETNGLDYVIIAELDKNILGIGDDTTYTISFYNNGNYQIEELKKSIKLFDNVPLMSQSQEIIDGRISDGLIVEGYDPVIIDAKFNLTYEGWNSNPNSFFPAKSYLKSGGAYLLGIVYYDTYGNRSGLTNIVDEKTTNLINTGTNRYGTRLFIPFLTDSLYDVPHGSPNLDMEYVPIVNAEIYHHPPEWAKYYQILRSRNEVIGRYIQFSAQQVYYANELTYPTPPASAKYIVVDISNITGRYLIENPNSRLVYDFVKGDRIRFIANREWSSLSPVGEIPPVGSGLTILGSPTSTNTIDSFFTFCDVEIVSYDAGNGRLKINFDSTTMPHNIEAGVLFEIYSPSDNPHLQYIIIYLSLP